MNEFIEFLVTCFIGWAVIQLIFALFQVGKAIYTNASEPEESDKDIKEYLSKHKSVTIVKVKIEQINEWWYGFYHTKEGNEIFIAQGTTYDEAVENCRQRLQEGTILKDLKIEFNNS